MTRDSLRPSSYSAGLEWAKQRANYGVGGRSSPFSR
jgi:hypothetical protein